MSEAGMRSGLISALTSLDAKSVENKIGSGTPDVNYIGGWMELKYLKFWPKSCDTEPVRFNHKYLKEQQLWAKRRIRAGGTVWLVV